MSFRSDIPEYESYTDGEFNMHTIPVALWSELQGLILRAASQDSNLVSILNQMATIILCEPTKNWGGSFLREDVETFVDRIRAKTAKGKTYILMDCLTVLVTVGHLTTDDINEFLEEHNLGYRCLCDARNIVWESRTKNELLTTMNDTQEDLKSISAQAYEEFERAKESLKTSKDERARKDAVRSCVSAMEAIVKEYGKNDDIKQATKNLRDELDTCGQHLWGEPDIVKEGDRLFNAMHRLYPDLRHGSTERSTMPIEEAEYWINRISIFIQYMKKKADSINR